MSTLKTYKKIRNYEINLVENPAPQGSPKRFLRIDNGVGSQYPTLYNDGSVGYYKKVPKDVQNYISKNHSKIKEDIHKKDG